MNTAAFRKKLSGCWTALATPFREDGSVDEKALRNLLKRQIRAGISGIVACGSTGEAATLGHDEYLRVISICVEECRDHLPVMAGVASNDTAKAVRMAEEAGRTGADALLVLSPYYNKPTQEGLYRHFQAAARAVSLPIVVYNIPGRTAVNVSPPTLKRLAEIPNIVGVKESSGNLDQVSEIARLLPEAFAVLSGDDSLTLPMLSVGARGVVSVVSNIAPAAMQGLCRAFLSGDLARARRLHRRLFALIKALFTETNPIPVKAALEILGLCGGTLRLPLTPISASNRALLRKELRLSNGLFSKKI